MTTAQHWRRLLTVREVADRLSISEPTVRRLIRAGVLPAVRVGQRPVRIDPRELDEYV